MGVPVTPAVYNPTSFDGSLSFGKLGLSKESFEALLHRKLILSGDFIDAISRAAIIEFGGYKYKTYRRDFKRRKVFALEI